MVLGGHGDTMVPMPKHTKIKNKILADLVKENKISKSKLDEIVNRTRKGGAEIVKLLEKGSAFYAPAASGVEMAEAYIKDQKKTNIENFQHGEDTKVLKKTYDLIQKIKNTAVTDFSIVLNT